MKKVIAIILVLTMVLTTNLTALANAASNTNGEEINLLPVTSNISLEEMQNSPYAFDEEPTGRTWEDSQYSTQGVKSAAALSALLYFLPFKGQVISAIATAIFGVTGAIHDDVYLVSYVEEYFVYDFEGSVIAYKYYVTIEIYKDRWMDDHVYTYNTTRESVSPISL